MFLSIYLECLLCDAVFQKDSLFFAVIFRHKRTGCCLIRRGIKPKIQNLSYRSPGSIPASVRLYLLQWWVLPGGDIGPPKKTDLVQMLYIYKYSNFILYKTTEIFYCIKVQQFYCPTLVHILHYLEKRSGQFSYVPGRRGAGFAFLCLFG